MEYFKSMGKPGIIAEVCLVLTVALYFGLALSLHPWATYAFWAVEAVGAVAILLISSKKKWNIVLGNACIMAGIFFHHSSLIGG